MEPQFVRLEEPNEPVREHMIEIRYGKAELKLPETVDLKTVVALLNTLRRHD